MDFKYKTFYIVREYDVYDNYWSIEGIFLSKDNAEAYVAELKNRHNIQIDEYDVPTDCVLERNL